MSICGQQERISSTLRCLVSRMCPVEHISSEIYRAFKITPSKLKYVRKIEYQALRVSFWSHYVYVLLHPQYEDFWSYTVSCVRTANSLSIGQYSVYDHRSPIMNVLNRHVWVVMGDLCLFKLMTEYESHSTVHVNKLAQRYPWESSCKFCVKHAYSSSRITSNGCCTLNCCIIRYFKYFKLR